MFHVVNHHKVRAIPLPKLDNRPIKGGEICADPYEPVLAVAKRKSGKTSVIFHILTHCTSPKTHVIIFCSTLYNDANWIEIRKWLEKRGNPMETYTSTNEDGEDQIQNLYQTFTDEAKEREQREEEPDNEDMHNKTDRILAYFDKHNIEKNKKSKKEKKEKHLSPKYVIIFDDISNELKSTWFIKLMKESRHFLAKIIIGTQYLHDIKPETLAQVGLWLIFKGLTKEKLELIHQRTDLDIPFEQFWNAYKLATTLTRKEQHPFFYVDVRHEELRRNFNKRIVFQKPQEEE